VESVLPEVTHAAKFVASERIVGQPYLEIISGLPVIHPQSLGKLPTAADLLHLAENVVQDFASRLLTMLPSRHAQTFFAKLFPVTAGKG
jgi:hypothetical protein